MYVRFDMIVIGIQTGKLSEGLKAVLSEFSGSLIKDIAYVTLPYPSQLKTAIKKIYNETEQLNADIKKISSTDLFGTVLEGVTKLQIKAVEKLLKDSGTKKCDVRAIGLRGLEILVSLKGFKKAHCSEIFDPAKLAQKTGIPVVYDFAADDIFVGGNGKNFAPVHFLHLSSAFVKDGRFPVCFMTSGNTSNMTLITVANSIKRQVISFDCGAFEYYINALRKFFYDKEIDITNMYGLNGQINLNLLNELYLESAITDDGRNFLDVLPPKVIEERFYKMLDKLKGYSLRAEDILRTLEYFSAYTVFMSLRFVADNVDFPNCFVGVGKGWKNSLIFYDFQNLLHGRGIILTQHKHIVTKILGRLHGTRFSFETGEKFGILSEFIEARIAADLAQSFLTEQNFNRRELTGCQKEVVCGLLCEVGKNTQRSGRGFTYSRVAKGWRKKSV